MYEGKVQITARIRLAESIKPGPLRLTLKLELPGLQRSALPGPGQAGDSPGSQRRTMKVESRGGIAMGKTLIKIGPADHGRPMSLAEFEHAKVQEGYLYELSRGVITVSDVPNRRHMLQLDAIRKRAALCLQGDPPGPHLLIATGDECKLLVPAFESERHPDLSRLSDRIAADRQRDPLAPLVPRDRHRDRLPELAEARLRGEARGIPAAGREGILDRRRPARR